MTRKILRVVVCADGCPVVVLDGGSSQRISYILCGIRICPAVSILVIHCHVWSRAFGIGAGAERGIKGRGDGASCVGMVLCIPGSVFALVSDCLERSDDDRALWIQEDSISGKVAQVRGGGVLAGEFRGGGDDSSFVGFHESLSRFRGQDCLAACGVDGAFIDHLGVMGAGQSGEVD